MHVSGKEKTPTPTGPGLCLATAAKAVLEDGGGGGDGGGKSLVFLKVFGDLSIVRVVMVVVVKMENQVNQQPIPEGRPAAAAADEARRLL
ncbi:hypothetical protein E2C01_019729 [Portunus trituberculatus]|uniref:Uncharacterized protein n=1 Tax=Portunus trituberculatus TaxID=210409 RepID=A0A5B7DZS4_PORTR|nr:hypothetical protein [Portunus trituberculatus]